MKGSCIILCFFLAGVLVGRLDIVPDAIARGDLASWALYLLLFVVGMGIGFDTRSWRILRELHIKVALVPLAVMAGTFGGAAMAWLALGDMPLRDVLGVGAGFGYYSLSSIMITRMGDAALGSVALLANITRELTTLLATPLLVRAFGGLAPVAAGGGHRHGHLPPRHCKIRWRTVRYRGRVQRYGAHRGCTAADFGHLFVVMLHSCESACAKMAARHSFLDNLLTYPQDKGSSVASPSTYEECLRMLQKVLLTVAALLLSTNVAFAERTVVFAHDATWPPMEFVDANKQIVGLAVDYVDAIAKEAGFKVVHKNVAWDGIFAGLAAGKYDAIASSVTITEERKKAMDFTMPYFDVKQALVVPKTTEAKTLEDMKGKTLGAQISTTGHFAIKRTAGVTAKSYDEIGLAMEDLFNGRIDGVVCDDPVATNYALQQEEYAKKLKIAFIVDTPESEYYGIAVKQGNKELVDLINKGIEAVKAKGIDAQLRAKWIGR